MLKPFVALALLAPTASALAGECEANFRKSGNPLVMTTYSSAVTVPNLATRDALAQMRGILVAEKMDVMAEDAEGGTLLVEQRQSGSARPIPTTINVSEVASGTRIEMAVKMERGVFSKVEQIQPYMCGLFARVKGGKEGVAAARKGAGATNTEATGNQDVFLFSRMIAREADKNAIAVNARHKGRKYTLTGRIDTLMEDGEDYNLVFDIPEISEMAIKPLPFDAQFRVGVSCLFKPNQLATVLAMREGQKVTLTGTVYKYDSFRKVIWLENCTKAK
ncbi:MAG TPA: hypothetical protein PLI83_00115 [Thermomonas sp.]|jgi:hypothetical protein|uniref:hypothetical protein n=1 Tax=Thermomonas sp. TaxID=1971895 RepID=UPI002C0E80F4|nr:hypothetical protein [Thermomonas sp.]HOU65858.1 hypothetical protein [Thermomonas sp.]HOZ23169.1 hypothetical protein [Thermomonas sp.]HPM56709.1 hypothetical protein [Thermomonas sp.]HPW13254.1 hypothetical protein [Thermomonas sp.]